MQHEYFQAVDWDGILTKQAEAPYLPTVEEDETQLAEPFFKDVKNRIKSDITNAMDTKKLRSRDVGFYIKDLDKHF